jgi:hypothetical protein
MTPGISAFARIIERMAQAYLGLMPRASRVTGLCQRRQFRGVLRTFVGTSPWVGGGLGAPESLGRV